MPYPTTREAEFHDIVHSAAFLTRRMDILFTIGDCKLAIECLQKALRMHKRACQPKERT